VRLAEAVSCTGLLPSFGTTFSRKNSLVHRCPASAGAKLLSGLGKFHIGLSKFRHNINYVMVLDVSQWLPYSFHIRDSSAMSEVSRLAVRSPGWC